MHTGRWNSDDPHAVGDGWSTIVPTAAGRGEKEYIHQYCTSRRDSTFLCMRDRSNHVQQYQSNNQSLVLSIAVALPCISTKFTGDDAGYIYCAPDIDSRKQQPTARLSHLDLAIASRLLLMRVLYCTTYTDCSYGHYIPIPRNSWLSLVLAPVQIYLSPGNIYSTRSRI